ncbi:Uncharacterized protein dnl_30420 [Desulfonema limicola]|uniref:Uncharacterized protein n=1 Tax=Desulfonema limicola TaxID=45656 RepID=A0A975GGZ0_9BACT|nr:Uncharacterized protein dnl_30420 [Desulfonema limicola]
MSICCFDAGNLLPGFNPCFHGSTTVSFQVRQPAAFCFWFQSLFSWKYNCEQQQRLLNI